MTDRDALKQRVCASIDARRDILLDISHRIHADPELGFAEHHAHDLLTGALVDAGVETTPGAFDLPTAFRAEAGSVGPTIAVFCEYDALPDIGHACGHNIIAAAGLGAALALAEVVDDAGGRVVALGSPAEEGGAGKVLMLQRGALDGIDAAMMVHPADRDLVSMDTLAIQQVSARYVDQSAHAAAFPWKGRNALDAAVLGYVNVAAMRQHISPKERVHGIFTRAGDRPNIVPREAETFWYVRAADMAGLEELNARVSACLRAGADAAGCEYHETWQPNPYAELRDNAPMVEAYIANTARLGRTVVDSSVAGGVMGSTDMGNVSYVVPSIHPMIRVAPAGVSIHSPAFAEYAGAESGDQAVLDGAKALAMTVVDLWTDAALLQRTRDAFSPPA
jgi:amidohydrolase